MRPGPGRNSRAIIAVAPLVRPELTSFARERYSPMRFDPSQELDPEAVEVLLAAAGRAPSAGNSQPWAFVVGRRGDAVHERLVAQLARSSAAWAPDASLLVVNLSQRYVEGSDLEYSEFADYDLGQAVAHLTFQAHAMGLAVHQFRAFDRDGVREALGVPKHLEVTSMAAVGRPADGAEHVAGAGTSRDRKPVADLLLVTEPRAPGS
jgi:nitroreductase